MALAFRRRVCRHLFGLNKTPTQQFDVLTAEWEAGTVLSGSTGPVATFWPVVRHIGD